MYACVEDDDDDDYDHGDVGKKIGQRSGENVKGSSCPEVMTNKLVKLKMKAEKVSQE